MNYEQQFKEGCETNNLEKVKESLSHMKLYYLNKQISSHIHILCKNNSAEILEYILNEFKINVEQIDWHKKTNEQKEEAHEEYKRFVGNHLSENLHVITTENNIDVLKVLVNKGNGFKFIQDFEDCFKFSYYHEDQKIIHFLLSLPDLERIVNKDGNYNKLLEPIITTFSPQGLIILQHFFNEEVLKEKINQTKLLKNAILYGNKKLVDFVVLGNNLLYSDKVNDLLDKGYFGNEKDTNVLRELFRQQSLLLCKVKLEQDLSIAEIKLQNKI